MNRASAKGDKGLANSVAKCSVTRRRSTNFRCPMHQSGWLRKIGGGLDFQATGEVRNES